MTFVELNRCFVPLKKDQEPILDVGVWGRKFAGWIDWPQLLDHRRVVLLAEASSGKTEEFRHQQQQLSASGRPAFFVRIEELADLGFEAALEPSSAESFANWRDGAGEAFSFSIPLMKPDSIARASRPLLRDSGAISNARWIAPECLFPAA